MTFQCIDINRCVLWIRTTKIKQALKRKGGYLWRPPCCGWQRLCLLFLEWQPYPRPAIVVDHGAYLFRFRNKRQYQRTTNDNVLCRGIILRYPRYTYICYDPLLESTYCFFFILLTISCIAVFITAVHASPFRVASMSAVRYDLSGSLPTCL